MATFTGTAGDDNFQGTDAVADVFLFDVNNLRYGDIVSGGGSATDPKDQLWLTGVDSTSLGVNFSWFNHPEYTPTFHYTCNVSGIEQVYLSPTGTIVSVTALFANSSSNGILEIFGSSAGADSIYIEGAGVELRTAQVIVHAGGGNDTVSNWGNILIQSDILDGGDGNDIINGSGTLYGGSGNDSISAYGNGTKAYGGTGDDTLASYGQNITLDGGDGIDTVNLSAISGTLTLVNIEKVSVTQFAGTAADYISLQSYNPILQTNAVAPTKFYVSGGGTFDLRTIGSGAFDAIIEVSYNPDFSYNTVIYGTSGHNTMLGHHDSETMYGGNSDDTLNGGESGIDNLYGGGGNDTLNWTANAASTLHGGAGNDTFTAGIYWWLNAGNAFGDDGDDTFILQIYDNPSKFTIDGGSGYDTLQLGVQDMGSSIVDDISGTSVTGIEKIYATRGLKLGFAQAQDVSSLYLSTGSVTIVGSGLLDLTGKISGPNAAPKIDISASGASNVTTTSGNDIITTEHVTSTGDIVVSGGDGNDNICVLLSSVWNVVDSAYGGNGDDYLWAATRDFSGGDPFLKVAKLYGGAGNDTFEYYSAGIFDGGADTDTLNVSQYTLDAKNITNIEVLNIKTSNQSLTTGFSDIAKFSSIKMTGDAGVTPDLYKIKLTLTGDGGVDLTGKVISYGLDVNFTGQTNGVIFGASEAADIIHGTAFGDHLSGGAGNDQLFGLDGDDVINGGAGNDFMDGGIGSNVLNGGTGDDTYMVQSATDLIFENFNSGYDDVSTNLASFILPDNFEVLYFTSGNSPTHIGKGNSLDNELNGSVGASDTLTYDGALANYIISYDSFNQQYLVYSDASGLDVVSNFEFFQFSDGTKTIAQIQSMATAPNFGDDTVNNLTGSSGNDSIFGFGGNDTLSGGSGNDLLYGGAGADTMRGGAGNDVYIVDDVGDVADEIGGSGTDSIRSSINFSLSDIVHVRGFIENLILDEYGGFNGTGNALGNTVVGNGNDNLLSGLDGNDTINGGGGADKIIGGAGSDTLTGGLGNDAFLFNITDLAAGQADTITDFTHDSVGVGDTIRLVGVNATNVSVAASGANAVISYGNGVINDTITAQSAGTNQVYLFGYASEANALSGNKANGFLFVSDAMNEASHTWSKYIQFFDNNGATDYQNTTNDDSTRAYLNLDNLGNEVWANYTENYSANNALMNRTVIYDDNSQYRTYLDHQANQPWAQYVESFDSQGRLDYRAVTNDNGSLYVTHLDRFGNQPWSQYVETFDPQGRLDYRVTTNDNGSLYVTHNDHNNNLSWSTYIDIYDMQSRNTFEQFNYDNGTRDDITIDALNQQSWARDVYSYSAANVLTQHYHVMDDGSIVVL
jgi:Ca2+-binding RTX toxin-like protein